jgi:hypothetical protein
VRGSLSAKLINPRGDEFSADLVREASRRTRGTMGEGYLLSLDGAG